MNSNHVHLFWLANDSDLSPAAIDAVRWTNSLDEATDILYNWLINYKEGKCPSGELWTKEGIRSALKVIGDY